MIRSFLQQIQSKLGLFASISLLLISVVSCSQLTQPRAELDHNLLAEIENTPAKNRKLNIHVSVSTQTAQLMKGNEVVARFPVSTGREGHSTPYGSFSIFNKEKDNRSSLYGSIYDASGNMVVPYADSRKNSVPPGGRFEGAAMPYTMHFTGYCAFHEGEVPYPPRKTSHGCIHLTPDISEILFRICPVGTPVSVSY